MAMKNTIDALEAATNGEIPAEDPEASTEPLASDPRLKMVRDQIQLMTMIVRATLQAASGECPCSPCNMLRQNASLLDPWLQALSGEGIKT